MSAVPDSSLDEKQINSISIINKIEAKPIKIPGNATHHLIVIGWPVAISGVLRPNSEKYFFPVIAENTT